MNTKIGKFTLLLFCLQGVAFAQQSTPLTLQEVIHLAQTQSLEAKASETKITGKKLELEASKNTLLPDAKLSGQYLAMTSPDVKFQIPMSSSSDPMSIKANQLLLGQASVSMPIYTGGKIKNSIAAASNAVKAEEFSALALKDQLAEQGINLYINLYKAQQTALLMEENIKRSEQRVADFKAMEANGIIPRNDLLKAELQLSNYKVALQEAQKNATVLNYQLVNFLKLDEATKVPAINLDEAPIIADISDATTALTNRNELKALQAQHDIALNRVNIEKSNALPKIALTGGYAALDVHNLITVKNAVNVGVGISYDIGSLYKNKKNVNIARNQVNQVDENVVMMNDKIRVQVQQANENYHLTISQNQLYTEAVNQANENYRIVKDKYDNGVADTDDLLEADVQQLQSKINLAISKANTVEKYYDLLLVNGQLTTK
ncbi:TolC family protein [Sphingobacterium sp. PCS056]|uniref:TolC family protein n=1 Tax=Sphingobacterium sp. PCS056 TaxID=2931400 RepID=UPI00200D89F1|nr:TolC family protein [Sphingobacterium sp. PCS056]UPZ36223.1 TolC family protein [Sphingobacterium sp. PCS056]